MRLIQLIILGLVVIPSFFGYPLAPAWATSSEMTLSDEVIQNAQIKTETASPAEIRSSLSFPGQIKLNTDTVAEVVPRLSGVVTEIRKNLGDRVKKNEVIAVIESRELANAKSDYIEAVSQLEFARISFAREEKLLKQKISAKEDYLASRQALQEAELRQHVTKNKLKALGISATERSALVSVKKGEDRRIIFSDVSLTRYDIHAPVDALVIEKNVVLGAAVDEKTPLFALADVQTLWVDARVLAKDLNRIRLGQKATVRSKNAGLESMATVIYIGQRFDELTQMGMVRLLLQNPEAQWRPGLFVTLALVQDAVMAEVAVSVKAVQRVGDRAVIFVQIGKRFEARPVTLGFSDGQKVEVISGLSGEEQVVTQNSFVIKAEWLNRGGELPSIFVNEDASLNEGALP